MSKSYRSTDPTNRHEQITMQGLRELADVVAQVPSINGTGYASINGVGVLQAGPYPSSLTTSYIDTYYPASNYKPPAVSPYPNFSALSTTSITVDGVNGLTLTQDGSGNDTLSIFAASATLPGVVTTVAQTFAGDKGFNGYVTIANSASITGNLSVGGNVTVNGNEIISGNIGVVGNYTSLNGNISTATGSVSAVTGNLTNINSVGTANLNNLNVGGGNIYLGNNGYGAPPIYVWTDFNTFTLAFTGVFPPNSRGIFRNGICIGYQ